MSEVNLGFGVATAYCLNYFLKIGLIYPRALDPKGGMVDGVYVNFLVILNEVFRGSKR